MKALNLKMPDAANGRKIAMAVGTFAVAMGIGFFMQQGDVDAARIASGSTAPIPQPVAEPSIAAGPESAPQSPPIVEVAAAVVEPELVVPALEESPAITEIASEVPQTRAPNDADNAVVTPAVLQQPGSDAVVAEELKCEPIMTANAQAPALVELIIAAPCHATQSFTLHHEGMMFTVATDAQGNATLVAPALADAAVFIAAFDDGVGAVADAIVTDMGDYDRVVLQWQGQSGFEIHAKEFGADYGQDGHVWRDAAREVTAAIEGQGGFLMQLGALSGSSPLLAEVYTFPTGKAPHAGIIDLTVEAEVTALNCAKDISAQTLERTPESQVRIADLTLSMPECSAIGEFLVMQDLLKDLTLAQG